MKTITIIPPPMEWISVKDKLPSFNENVLIWSPSQKITGAYLLELEPIIWMVNVWDEYDSFIVFENVTHWAYPPASPDEDFYDGFFPPPWNITENPEKTAGWIEFQKALKKDPQLYSIHYHGN